MPLYISNTNRVETLQGVQTRGINSTTTTTLVPPVESFWWAKAGDFQSGSIGGQWFQADEITQWNVSGSGQFFGGARAINYDLDNPPPQISNNFGLTPYGGADKSNTTSIWRSPFSVDFTVKPSIFGKVCTFTNSFTTGSGKWMLATYVAYSGSTATYEFVPPSSSIQRCVTYPYLTYFCAPMIGGYGDGSYTASVAPSAFGADCQYDTDCQCIYCYNNSAYGGGDTLPSGSAPCAGATTTTTTSTTTTSTTTTSTTTTTTTTTASLVTYQVEYLIVGGGGGGGSQESGNNNLGSGGGGAGGFLSGSLFVTQSQAYSFVVGAGGGADTSGVNSTAFTLTAIGGGYGALAGATALAGANGGSGGGGGSRGGTLSVNAPGTGTAGQGNNGGDGTQESVGAGGGGGGATSAGSTPAASTYGGGGSAKLWLNGTAYSKGGDAAGRGTTKFSAVAGDPNTGNGGGGIKATGGGSGASGGSGIVIVRYVSGSASGTGGTITNSGGYTYHTFTGSATYTG
jgi:hypothetical protein